MSRLVRRAGLALAVLVLGVALAAAIVLTPPRPDRPLLPFGPDRGAAIAIIDDTDFFQFETTAPVYALLDRLGVRVTKTVWVFDSAVRPPANAGLSLADPAYARWVAAARAAGHEITLHSASPDDDARERMLAAYDRLRADGGAWPRLEVFHGDNREALYWGALRLPAGPLRGLYRAKSRFASAGQEPGSPYFWLDVARERVRYVRGYTFDDVDTWAVNPTLPFDDPATPGAPLWFASSNGRTVREFTALLAPENLDRLVRAHGVSLVYTHFGARFGMRGHDGRVALAPGLREALERAARDRRLEFVPAGELLDRMRALQVVRAALDRGTRRIEVPRDLAPALAALSVDPAALPAGWPRGAAAPRAGRPSLREWANGAGLEIVTVDRSPFEGAPRIGPREKWRLVGRWLVTQLSNPT